MGITYCIEGRLKVRKSREAVEILQGLECESVNVLFGEDGMEMPEILPDGDELVVRVTGSMQCSHSAADEFEDGARKIVPHLVEPVLLETMFDGDGNDLYLGPPESEKPARSKAALQQILDRLPVLQSEERAALKTYL